MPVSSLSLCLSPSPSAFPSVSLSVSPSPSPSLLGQEVEHQLHQLHSSHGLPACSAFLPDDQLHGFQACLALCSQEPDILCSQLWLGNAARAMVSPVAHSASWLFLGHVGKLLPCRLDTGSSFSLEYLLLVSCWAHAEHFLGISISD